MNIKPSIINNQQSNITLQMDLKQTLISKTITPNYTTQEQYTLQNGAIIQWVCEDLLAGYNIEVIKEPNEGKTGCGNPFNMMNKNEYDEIKSNKPQNLEIPCGVTSNIRTKIYNNETDLKTQID